MEQVVYYHKRDKAYPERMRPYPDMPAGIYTKGRLPFEGVPSAAIVGARACSVYGRVQAKRYARELAAAGLSSSEAARQAAQETGYRKSQLYTALLESQSP